MGGETGARQKGRVGTEFRWVASYEQLRVEFDKSGGGYR
jgi:hypothetical protein